MRRLALLLALVLALASPAVAVQPDGVLADKVLEARARALSAELRCLVCQNQSIDESDAPLARDLRLIIRERLTAGATDAEIVDYLVDRYGEFVLLKPRLSARTFLLWAGPFAVLLIGIAVLWRRRAAPAPASGLEKALSEEEKARLGHLLEDGK
jgi:cytochrome c-type biogenesis protein CcmH